jgi:hypothetical protein
MVKRNKRPAALKHGAYSQTDVLPAEDAAAFKKLRDDLVAEFLPHGAVEENIVADLASLYWRKQNMATYRLAERARNRRSEILREMNPGVGPEVDWPTFVINQTKNPEEIRAQNEAVDEQAREELGEAWDLIEIGEVATVEYLLKELSVAERLDGMIDRALKRLLFVRGIKSFAQTSSEGPTPRSIKGPKAA